jgi:hypothetical protein
MNDQQSPKAKAARWELWRQDDNGVGILISCYTDRDVGIDELRRLSHGSTSRPTGFGRRLWKLGADLSRRLCSGSGNFPVGHCLRQSTG